MRLRPRRKSAASADSLNAVRLACLMFGGRAVRLTRAARQFEPLTRLVDPRPSALAGNLPMLGSVDVRVGSITRVDPEFESPLANHGVLCEEPFSNRVSSFELLADSVA